MVVDWSLITHGSVKGSGPWPESVDPGIDGEEVGPDEMMTPSLSTVMGSSANMTVETCKGSVTSSPLSEVEAASMTCMLVVDEGVKDVKSVEALKLGVGGIVATGVDVGMLIVTVLRPAEVARIRVEVTSTVDSSPLGSAIGSEKITPGVSTLILTV